MSAISLYQITKEQEYLNYLLEESGGELTPEIEEALAINMENMAEKSANYCATIAKYSAMGAAIKAEVQRLQAYAKTCARIEETLKARMLDAMQTFGIDKMEVGTYRLGTRKSTAVVIDNEAAIPSQFIKVTTSVDKTAIKAAIKEGQEVAGAHIETNINISIR